MKREEKLKIIKIILRGNEMAKKSLFFRKEIVKEYFENESEKHFQDLLKKRNVSEEIDENILATHLFIALHKNGLLNKFLKKVIKKELKEPKITFEKPYKCSEEYLTGIKKYFRMNPHYDIRIRRKGAPKEGKSWIDVVIEDEENLIFIEVKYLSDISSKTTFDFARNQIIRNVDVLLENANNKNPFFILLTPSVFKNDRYAKHSKLYSYKIEEYSDQIQGIKNMKRDSGLSSEKLKKIKGKIFWATFEEDILSLLKDNNATKGIKSYLKMIFPREMSKK